MVARKTLPQQPSPALPCTPLELLERNSTARIHVLEDLLLQLHHVLLEVHHDTAQVRVLALEQLHLVLQLRDPLQLALPTLGGGHPIPLALPLQLLALLVVHVDGTEGRRVGHRLRLILDLHRQRFVCGWDREGERDRSPSANIHNYSRFIAYFPKPSCISWFGIQTKYKRANLVR